MKKGGFLRNVLDTIRSNQNNQQGPGGSGCGLSARTADFGGQLKSQHFALSQVARHGFPEQPTALAYDPVQRIAAVGTKSGTLRIFGRPGVDIWAQHKPEYAITHIRFVVNQGAVITVTADESIHLWSLRGPHLKLQLSASSGASSSCSPPAPSPAPGAASAATSHHHLHQHQHQHLDSGAQPGDPDYLSEGGCGSPLSADKSRQSYSKQPEILHTLKFQREHITCLHQTLMSKWLYIGTERGNVHVANVETFELSGYSIAWNKAIELSRKTHPGAIIQLSECPQDSNKLLIGYESGCIVLWDLKGRAAEGRYYNTENLLWLAWHYEGKQFVAAHGDGSLVTWQTRSNARPTQILHPHAKASPQGAAAEQAASAGTDSGSVAAYLSNQQQLAHQQQPMSSSFARALHNELYRPINKVEWKTSKSGEQFLLFSGGLPYDGLEQEQPPPADSAGSTCAPQQQYLKAGASPVGASLPSPISPSISPSAQQQEPSRSRQSSLSQQQQAAPGRVSRNLKSTSLTVMYGKSITVLEMDDTIIDFITVCDSSPYENDASDPFVVIVLLSNDLILIDLTSSGYPSFDSPYPSANLSESPVTCVHYLADCSSDLIPFLYSTSQNLVSRAPKKGFSDKEWPINGGEWNQPMQSYPELVLTGHADGTIKFWDMSGVNFDLISKIKTSKLFEKPSRSPKSILVAARPRVAGEEEQLAAYPLDEPNVLAIERLEYCAGTKHLLAAGASGQVIQFRLNRREHQAADLSTVLVEPPAPSDSQQQAGGAIRQQLLLKARSQPPTASSSSGGSSSSASSSQRNRLSGFQPELVCLTPALVRPLDGSTVYLSQAPPKVTALALQAAHSILAFAHELGIVLVDTVQKSVILSASLSDLYGGASIMSKNRDISIQPFATSSILQHHYQATSNATLPLGDFSGSSAGSLSGGANVASQVRCSSAQNNITGADNGGSKVEPDNGDIDNGFSSSAQQSAAIESGGSLSQKATNLSQFTQSPRWTLELEPQWPAGPLLSPGPRHAHPLSPALSPSQQVANGSQFVAFSQQQQSPKNHRKRSQQQQQDSTLDDVQHNKLQATSSALTSASPHHLQQQQPSGASAAASQLHQQQQQSNGKQHTNSRYQFPPPLRPPLQPIRLPSPGAAKLACRPPRQQQPQQTAKSRFTTNSLFQRQLSTNALGGAAGSRPGSGGPRAFQRQATASQLFSSSSGGPAPADGLSNKQRAAALLASARNEPAPSSAGSSASLGTGSSSKPVTPRRPAKNKRIISRMLSISAIHTSSDWSEQTAQPDGPASAAAPNSSAGGDQAPDKIDSSFTRSRSSSASSAASNEQQAQQQSASESIQCLCFLDWQQASSTCSNKSLGSTDALASQLALYLGTSQGCVLLVNLLMPDSEDNRVLQLQSVQAEPIPQAAVKLAGSILCLASFTSEPNRQQAPSGGSGGSSLEGEHGAFSSASGGPNQPVTSRTDSSAHSSFDLRSATFLTLVSEKQVRVYQLPQMLARTPEHQPQGPHRAAGSQPEASAESPIARLLTNKANCVARAHLGDSSYACRAQLVQMPAPEETCLVSYLASGNLQVHSLPQLRPLLDVDFVPFTSARIGSSMQFSRNGHCLYQPSSGEICKFTISAQYKALVNEITGSLFVAREMPEMPRTNFFKSLFSAASSAASRQSDRDELFGECAAGKPSRGVAKHIPSAGPGVGAGMEKLKGATAGTLGHELRSAREGLDERGEKLSEVEDRTLAMLNQSEGYAQAAHQLAQKFKDKKWYQF